MGKGGQGEVFYFGIGIGIDISLLILSFSIVFLDHRKKTDHLSHKEKREKEETDIARGFSSSHCLENEDLSTCYLYYFSILKI